MSASDKSLALLRRIIAGDSPIGEHNADATELRELALLGLIAPQPGIKGAWMATERGGAV